MITLHTIMSTKFHQFVTISLLISALLNLSPLVVADGDCPYPCFPPPTGGGATTPAPPTTQTGTYPPPLDYSPPTTGDIPNYPPPSGSAGFGKPPPPPDPILPYFPYYYKKGLHPSDQSSAAAPLHGLMFKIFGSGLIACLIFFSLLLF